MHTIPTPTISHLTPDQLQPGKAPVEGAYRILEQDGRRAVHCTSIHSLVTLAGHTLAGLQGSLSLWVLPLEDVNTYRVRDVMFTAENKNPWLFPLLADTPDMGNMEQAAFALNYDSGWHPSLECKFYRGDNFQDILDPPHKAHAVSSHFHFHRQRWYQMTVTWDFDAERIGVYANGVRVATHDVYHDGFHRDLPGETLYAGKCIYAFGQLDCYEQALTDEQVGLIYQQQAGTGDPELVKELVATHMGREHPLFSWQPDADWLLVYKRSLTEPDILDEFYIQGVTEEVAIEREGLRIRTPAIPYSRHSRDQQMYLWTERTFEGDIVVDVEFQSLQDFGLALLLFHGSGMSREDFMEDYPRRTSGLMKTVHSEDVRNYHVEFFRKMNVLRNDVASIAMIKNPYQWPLAYGTHVEQLAANTWHRLQVRMVDGHVTLVMNGQVWAEGDDRSNANNGPRLNFGRIALRCMVNTHMRFRNLKVYTHTLPYTVV